MLSPIKFIKKDSLIRGNALPFYRITETGTTKGINSVLVSTADVNLAFEIGKLFFTKPCAIAIYSDGFYTAYEVEYFNKYIEHFNRYNVTQGYIVSLDEPAVEYKTRNEIIAELLDSL